VKTLEKVNPELIAGYIKGKSEFDRLFPRFFEVVKEKVEEKLAGKYSVNGIVGEDHRRIMMDRFPELGNRIPIDWVAFGFEYLGYNMYDAHVGVIFLTDDYPIQYHVGFHLLDFLWVPLENRIKAVPWETFCYKPTYYFEAPTREYRIANSPRVFDIDNPEAEAESISDQVVRYYSAGAPILESGKC
jgi:hypothetical protein